jgi:hypothetical protein
MMTGKKNMWEIVIERLNWKQKKLYKMNNKEIRN